MTRADVLVIGGGIAGVSAAARIAEGARVILLEREARLGVHSTGRSAAMLIDGYGNAAIRALTARARPLFEAPDPAFWPAPLLARRGELLIARPGEEAPLAQARRAGGVALTPAEAVALVPILAKDAMVGAVLDPEAADIDVDLLLQGFLRLLRRLGGRVESSAEVLALSRTEGLWTARTPRGDFSAPVVVNAAGAWADALAVLAGAAPLGLRPLRRSAALLPAPSGGVAGWPLFGGIAEDWYAKPVGGKLMVSPAEEEETPPGDVWADELTLAEGLARFEAMTVMAVTRVEHSWAGLRSFLPDRTPAVGFDPAAPGLLWLTGQGGYGIQTAPALAEFAAALVLGGEPALDGATRAALAPDRSMRRLEA